MKYILLLLLTLTGCSAGVEVTVDSKPTTTKAQSDCDPAEMTLECNGVRPR